MRYGALLLNLLLPALYIALIEFHPQWVPARLLNIIMTSKQEVPFSTAAEALGLLIAFELLQESQVSAVEQSDIVNSISHHNQSVQTDVSIEP